MSAYSPVVLLAALLAIAQENAQPAPGSEIVVTGTLERGEGPGR
jgi:hypothetical protein